MVGGVRQARGLAGASPELEPSGRAQSRGRRGQRRAGGEVCLVLDGEGRGVCPREGGDTGPRPCEVGGTCTVQCLSRDPGNPGWVSLGAADLRFALGSIC